MYSSTKSIDINLRCGYISARNQESDSLLKLSARAFGNALMHITGEKLGIVEVLHQDVLSARLKRGILDFPIKHLMDTQLIMNFIQVRSVKKQ